MKLHKSRLLQFSVMAVATAIFNPARAQAGSAYLIAGDSHFVTMGNSLRLSAPQAKFVELDLASGDVIRITDLGEINPGPAACCSPDGQYLYFISNATAIDVVALDSGAVTAKLPLGSFAPVGMPQRAAGIALLPDGSKGYFWGDGNALGTFKPGLNVLDRAIPLGISAGDPVRSVEMNQDGSRLYAWTESGVILTIDSNTDNVIDSLHFSQNISDMAVDPAGARLYICGYRGDPAHPTSVSVLTYNLASKAFDPPIPTPFVPFPLWIAGSSPDGETVYLGGSDGQTFFVASAGARGQAAEFHENPVDGGPERGLVLDGLLYVPLYGYWDIESVNAGVAVIDIASHALVRIMRIPPLEIASPGSLMVRRADPSLRPADPLR